MDSEIQERLDAYVNSRGLRQTQQRNEIVSVIFSVDEHFTVEELLDRLKAKRIKASRATVYRTLKLLVDAKLLVEIDLGDGVTTFDPNYLDHPVHNHLVCIDCGKVTEFDDQHLEILNDCLTRRLGFRPVRKSLRIEAGCEQLRASGSCVNLISARINGKRMPNSKK